MLAHTPEVTTYSEVTVYSFVVMGGAMLAALGLAIWEQRRGRALGSSVLVADGKRALSDVLVSLSVIVGPVAALVGAPLIDLLVALGIAGMIAWTGWTILRDVSAVLTDANDLAVAQPCVVWKYTPSGTGRGQLSTAPRVSAGSNDLSGARTSLRRRPDDRDQTVPGAFPAMKDQVIDHSAAIRVGQAILGRPAVASPRVIKSLPLALSSLQ